MTSRTRPRWLENLPEDDAHQWTALGKRLADIRRRVAALDLPDEGMRGTAADVEKANAAEDPAVLSLLAVGLRSSRGIAADVPAHAIMEHAAAAAAIVRSIALTPTAAHHVACKLGSALVEAVDAVMENAGPSEAQRRALAWLLPAVMRLAQHRECHQALIRRGSLPTLHRSLHTLAKGAARQDVWRGYAASDGTANLREGRDHGMRLDLIACITLGFLSETVPTLALLVPPRAVESLVCLVRLRLDAPTGMLAAEELVRRRGFLGLPMYFRPRFVLQALRWLVTHSLEHTFAARATELPTILRGLQSGLLANDAPDNLPFGTEDAIAVAQPLSTILEAAGDPKFRARRKAELAVSVHVRASDVTLPPAWCMCHPRSGAAVLTGRSIRTERHGVMGERPEIRFIAAIEDSSNTLAQKDVAPLPVTLHLRARLGERTFCDERLSTAAWEALPASEQEFRLELEKLTWPTADMASVRRASTFDILPSSSAASHLRRVELLFYAGAWELKGGTIELSLRPLEEESPLLVLDAAFDRVHAPLRSCHVLSIAWDTVRNQR